jgi:class 3 adenylate cyclase
VLADCIRGGEDIATKQEVAERSYGHRDWIHLFVDWRDHTIAELKRVYEGNQVWMEFDITTETEERSFSMEDFPYKQEALEHGLEKLRNLVDRLKLAVDSESIKEDSDIATRAERQADPGTSIDDLPSGTLTFLMTDVEDSSALYERDPVAMKEAMERHDHVIAESVRASGGIVVMSQGEGDSMLAVFRFASGALAAALNAQRELRTPGWPVNLRVRMAVSTGEAEVSQGNYRGPAVNRCGRLRGHAKGGQVLVAAATYDVAAESLPAGAKLVSLGTVELKGLTRPEVVYELRDHDVGPRLSQTYKPGEGVPRDGVVECTQFPGPRAIA